MENPVFDEGQFEFMVDFLFEMESLTASGCHAYKARLPRGDPGPC
jgi:hypothetical protein